MDDPFDTFLGLKGKMILLLCSFASILTCGITGHVKQFEYNNDHPTSNTVFLFEMVRHGARAPLVDNVNSVFPVGPGMLTP